MSSLKLQLLAAMLVCALGLHGQNNNVKGLYVNGTSQWLGDSARENQVLRYVQTLDFNSITLYDLSIAWTPIQKNKLANFIHRAKTIYGVQQVGAAGETFSFFDNYIIPYNNSRTNASERFDVLNYEFEFWIMSSINNYYSTAYLAPNGYSSDTAGAFAFAWKEFQRIDNLCISNGLISEIYLGWPNAGQMQKIASIADRILIHSYRPTDADVYQYTKTRLQDIAALKGNVKVLPIFSSEPLFMKNWLLTHPISDAYQTYASDYASDTGTVKQYTSLSGYQWFVYSTMPGPFVQASIAANGPVTFCNGGSVTLTANQGASYLWSPGGATTRSIVVNTTGNYSVRVTDNNGHVSTSSPETVTTTNAAITPVITAIGSTTICQGGYVTLTTPIANSYHWSNGMTTQVITVDTSGDYTVTATTAGCTATSAITSVNIITPPTVPVITSDVPLSICPGSTVTLTAPVNGGYLWSNGETTRSIVVNASGNYSVRVYSGPYCFNVSSPSNVVVLPAPTVPTVTVSGLTVLSNINPTVTLTSASGNAYEWSGGQTTQSIVVNSQGTYRVTVAGTNGCKSTSLPVFISANGCTPPAVPVITAAGSPNLMPGQTVTLFSSLAPGYLWSTGETTRAITVSTAGNYTVRTYNGPACFSNSLPFNVKIIPARKAIVENLTETPVPFRTYPNPAENNLIISFSSSAKCTGTFIVADYSGKIVFSRTFEVSEGNNENSFDISALAAGIYYSKITLPDSQESNRIVVVD